MKSSIVITTKNRKSELVTTLRSAVSQQPISEIIVIDDGSTDGTEAMIRAEFPRVIIRRHNESRGLIVRRNEGARIATGDVIISLDDDAEFSTPHVVAQTMTEFSRREVGAVAIPYIDVHRSERVNQKAPDEGALWITDAYIGTAHAVRKNVFLALGGYREQLIHQGEEMDFCLRMLDAGYVVRMGSSDPIHHFESTKRDWTRMDWYGSRNAVLFAWQNCPAVFLPVHLGATTFRTLLWTLEPRRLRTRARAVAAGYRAIMEQDRQPVRLRSYCLFRRLKKRGPRVLDDQLLYILGAPSSDTDKGDRIPTALDPR
jgi:glycosyltransferase involved in cell wall biosynthesis